MQLPEFQAQIDRLVAQFNKSAYSQERVNLIWKTVKDQPVEWFRETVDRLLGACRQAPLVPDFQEHLAIYRERTKRHEPDLRREWRPNGSWNCSRCTDLGYFSARDASGYFYGFRCHCEAGDRYSSAVPRFTKQHEDAGFVLSG